MVIALHYQLQDAAAVDPGGKQHNEK